MKYLLCFLLIIFACRVNAQLTYETLRVEYDTIWKYKNLRIIPIRPKGPGSGQASANSVRDLIPLNQAISKGYATVSERGTSSIDNVHWLRINNKSDKSIYISSGEVIGGGRQDRMIAKDTILIPSGKDQYVPVMCVEEGRWSEKEKKFQYGAFANSHLRKTLDLTKNQVLIWREVNSQLQQGSINNKTLSYLSRTQDKKLVQAGDEYFNYFIDKFKKSDSTIVGFVCLSGDKVIGSDIFAGSNLFYGQLEPMLRGYIDDAVLFGGNITATNKDAKEYMDKVLTDEKSQEIFVKQNGKIFKDGGRVIHINTF